MILGRGCDFYVGFKIYNTQINKKQRFWNNIDHPIDEEALKTWKTW